MLSPVLFRDLLQFQYFRTKAKITSPQLQFHRDVISTYGNVHLLHFLKYCQKNKWRNSVISAAMWDKFSFFADCSFPVT